MKLKLNFALFYPYIRVFAVFWLFLAILLYFLWSPSAFNLDLGEIQTIQSHIDRQIKNTNKEVHQFLPKIKKQGIFAAQARHFHTTYPYYIFQNGRLKYWSDYHIVPEYAEVKGNYKTNFRRLSQGDFIVCKEYLVIEEDTIEIFSTLPLYRHYKINNQYLHSKTDQRMILYQGYKIAGFQKNAVLNVYSPHKEFLFGLVSTGQLRTKSHFQMNLVYICLGLFWLLIGIDCWKITQKLEKKGNYEISFFIHFLWLSILNITIFIFLFPYFLSTTLISIFYLLIFLLQKYRKSWTWKKLQLMKGCFYCERTWSIVFLGLISGWIILYEWTLRQILFDDKINIDITKNLDFSYYSLWGIGFWALSSVVFFLGWHLLLRSVLALFERHWKKISYENYSFWIISLSLTIIIVLGGKYGFWLGMVLLASFWILVAKLPRQLYKLNYNASIYLFSAATLISIVCVYALQEYEIIKSKDDKRNFATRILPENDAPTEQFLSEIIKNIPKDSALTQSLADTAQNFKRWADIIKRQYLQNNFNQYEINVLIFDKDGNLRTNTAEAEGNLQIYQKNYKNVLYATDNPNIWFIDKGGVNVLKRYLVFLELKQRKKITSHIILDLKLKRTSFNYVFPELLVEKNYHSNKYAKNYSYALYEDSTLIYSTGEFNYEKDFPNKLFKQENLFLKGIIHQKYKHLAVTGGLKKRVVVSAPAVTFNDYFSIFAFFFLSIIFLIFSVLIVSTLWRGQFGRNAKFSTRIQIYLNIAFFLPLLTVSLTTWSILQNTYKEDFEKTFALQTESLARNIAPQLKDYKENKIDKEVFTQQLQNIAQFAEADLNVFDETGKLLSSSRPAIYENEILSKYMNPEALRQLKNERNKQVILDENAGTLFYQSVYAPIRYVSGEKVQINGFVSIPFFEAQTNLQKKSLAILSIILNIFTGIFLVFLILSYFASQVLTLPLRLITQQIRKTTFQNYSEPLVWDTKDEIGVFVDEYNKMLKKLDSSKENLARNQKETAWREIAQQVAHEIKNPLTPMKLSLQMMQRRMEDQGETVKNLFERSVDTLLTQVEILDDIASSFSAFAKMPVPLSERFEISAILKDTIHLYANQENLILKTDIKQGKFFVRGDNKLIGRIFVNLIKNAIEAMPDDRTPEIKVCLKAEEEGLILIAVKDNGMGISEEIGEKIFMPNFTTKSTGSGIGLAVAKRGIEHAGGRIWFESIEEEGTTFFIELPLIE
jgi:nitrogen fixation/metabolism regulation signal transduction histidine kinase